MKFWSQFRTSSDHVLALNMNRLMTFGWLEITLNVCVLSIAVWIRSATFRSTFKFLTLPHSFWSVTVLYHFTVLPWKFITYEITKTFWFLSFDFVHLWFHRRQMLIYATTRWSVILILSSNSSDFNILFWWWYYIFWIYLLWLFRWTLRGHVLRSTKERIYFAMFMNGKIIIFNFPNGDILAKKIFSVITAYRICWVSTGICNIHVVNHN